MEVVGLDKDKVLTISKVKDEEDWVKDYRLDSYKKFERPKITYKSYLFKW